MIMIPNIFRFFKVHNLATHNADIVKSARLCKYVYEDPLKRRFVYLKKNRVGYLAFKGTSSISDWSFNLNSRLNEEDIHIGFHNYANLCMRTLDLYKILLQKQELNKLVISGHSLGCVAIIICLYFVLQQYDEEEITKDQLLENIHVVLMGCPKVGGRLFAEKYNRLIEKYNIDITAYVTNYDIVPHVPVSPTFKNTNSLYTKQIDCDAFLFTDDNAHIINKFCAAHSILIYLKSLEHIYVDRTN